MSRISVIGTGYVGLVTGACLADLGSQVTCIDVDADKIAMLQDGDIPIYEPGLEEIVRRNAGLGRLRFTASYGEGLKDADFVFVAVNTPPGASGEADLSHLRAAVRSIAEHLHAPAVVVNKSTAPIGTGHWTARLLRRYGSPVAAVVANPEFLREGTAISDFLKPDRIVIGADDRWAAGLVARLYRPLESQILITDLRTAEAIKYASNAFLATKISFINEMAEICDRLGADVEQVAQGMGLDRRIGPAFLEAGVGFGGSCFPKDVQALAHMAAAAGYRPRILHATLDVNQDARLYVVRKLEAALGQLKGATIGVLGLAFKPNTDDLREAPALDIIRALLAEGVTVAAYDPVAMEQTRSLLPNVQFCASAYEAAAGADALVLVTEWGELRTLDLVHLHSQMSRPVFVDGRNAYDPDEMARHGFDYYGIGRGDHHDDRLVDRAPI